MLHYREIMHRRRKTKFDFGNRLQREKNHSILIVSGENDAQVQELIRVFPQKHDASFYYFDDSIIEELF
jgi:hypothetical protein